MLPEPKLPEFIQETSSELPPEDYELAPEDYELAPEDLTAIKNASAWLLLPYERLFRYFNSAPPARDKERLQIIEGWRKGQRQQINGQCADATKIGTAKIGTGQRGAVVDQKQQAAPAHPENRKSIGQKSIGQEVADQNLGLDAAQPKKKTQPENKEELEKKEELERKAEQRLTAYHQEVACQAEEAEKKFWDLLPNLAVPPGMTFVPFTNSKLFTAAECLEFPLEDATRQWFQALCEEQKVTQITASALQQKRSWQETLGMAASIHRRFASAGSAWDTHVHLLRQAIEAGHPLEGHPLEMFFMEEPFLKKPAAFPQNSEPGKAKAGQDAQEAARKARRGRKSLKASAATESSLAMPESSLDWLAAWAAAEVGEQYLLPLMKKFSPEATPKQMRQELTLEIWGAVLSLGAYRLTVPAFCRLPSTAAATVRELCSSTGEDVDRLAPEAMRRLLAASAPAPDPLAAVTKAERAEHIQGHIRALPPRQRHCLELFLQGYSRDEIAEKMGCKPETVKTHLSCARKRLRSELAEPDSVF